MRYAQLRLFYCQPVTSYPLSCKQRFTKLVKAGLGRDLLVEKNPLNSPHVAPLVAPIREPLPGEPVIAPPTAPLAAPAPAPIIVCLATLLAAGLLYS